MNFEKIIILVMLFILAAFASIYPLLNSESTDLSLINDVKHISKEIGPRPAGSKVERNSAEYLGARFKDYGVKTEIQEFEYYSMSSKSIKKSVNVIGTVNGTSPEQIIICADLDTVKDESAGNYTEGANDDATGLAVLIGLSEKYQHKKPYFTLKLIGFGASEDPYTFPVNASPGTGLNSDEYNKIMNIPYLIGARHYLLENQDSINNIVAVISLEAVGIGDPCFVGQDSFVQNNQFFADFLVLNARTNGFKAEKIDFMTFNRSAGGEAPISHVYLPFSYANIPSTFLIYMKNPDTGSSVHSNPEVPGYLTMDDNYENLVKNNGGEKELQKHLDSVLYLVEDSIDKIPLFLLGRPSINEMY